MFAPSGLRWWMNDHSEPLCSCTFLLVGLVFWGVLNTVNPCGWRARGNPPKQTKHSYDTNPARPEGRICPSLSASVILSLRQTIGGQAQVICSRGGFQPFFSIIVLFKTCCFPWVSGGFWRFSGKKDPWKEWGRCPEICSWNASN